MLPRPTFTLLTLLASCGSPFSPTSFVDPQVGTDAGAGEDAASEGAADSGRMYDAVSDARTDVRDSGPDVYVSHCMWGSVACPDAIRRDCQGGCLNAQGACSESTFPSSCGNDGGDCMVCQSGVCLVNGTGGTCQQP